MDESRKIIEDIVSDVLDNIDDTKSENVEKKSIGIFIGPEGGFSDAEFAKLDASGATGISLGKTILRAELAAAVAISKIIQ